MSVRVLSNTFRLTVSVQASGEAPKRPRRPRHRHDETHVGWVKPRASSDASETDVPCVGLRRLKTSISEPPDHREIRGGPEYVLLL